jgi:hypothetical protein
LDNEKIFELANNFHNEINSTKEEFTKKINLKFNQIEQKFESSDSNTPNMESYNKSMSNFSENFTKVKNTMGTQVVVISKLATVYKILLGVTIACLATMLIILFKLPATSKEKSSIVVITPTNTVVNSTSSKETSKNTVDDYSKLVKDYRLAYIKAVNSNDRSDLDKFILTGSPFDKYITEKLSSAKNLKIELKDSKVEKFENSNEYIYVYVIENLGTKESTDSSYKYKDYSMKYTIKKSGDSYTFEKSESF